jgi:hypothetical protein
VSRAGAGGGRGGGFWEVRVGMGRDGREVDVAIKRLRRKLVR